MTNTSLPACLTPIIQPILYGRARRATTYNFPTILLPACLALICPDWSILSHACCSEVWFAVMMFPQRHFDSLASIIPDL